MQNMHYGMVDKEHFVHDNMQPNTSRRDFEVNNGFYQDRKLQIYSGIDQHYKHKKEVGPFSYHNKILLMYMESLLEMTKCKLDI